MVGERQKRNKARILADRTVDIIGWIVLLWILYRIWVFAPSFK